MKVVACSPNQRGKTRENALQESPVLRGKQGFRYVRQENTLYSRVTGKTTLLEYPLSRSIVLICITDT